jgi:hypothetical protein
MRGRHAERPRILLEKEIILMAFAAVLVRKSYSMKECRSVNGTKGQWKTVHSDDFLFGEPT